MPLLSLQLFDGNLGKHFHKIERTNLISSAHYTIKNLTYSYSIVILFLERETGFLDRLLDIELAMTTTGLILMHQYYKTLMKYESS